MTWIAPSTAASRLLEKYKIENETLRAEVADMKANGFVSSRPTTAEQEEILELRSQNEALVQQIQEFGAQQKKMNQDLALLEQNLHHCESKLRGEMAKTRETSKEMAKAAAKHDSECESIVCR